MIVAAIIIAALLVLILTMGALLHRQAEKIAVLKQVAMMTDEALTDALDGKNPDLFLESAGMDVILVEKKKPWDGYESLPQERDGTHGN